MDEMTSPHSLSHQPAFLLAYEGLDGPYADDTDCKYLSVGLAQYDARSVSVKILRHTGKKWSRQSEEMPVHRACDLVALVALTLEAECETGSGVIRVPPGFFENQKEPIALAISALLPEPKRDAFKRKITDDLVRRRLGKLWEVLDRLHGNNEI